MSGQIRFSPKLNCKAKEELSTHHDGVQPTKLCDKFWGGGGTLLLIIDPQVDFHTGGSLAVPGADEDATRISDMIAKHRNQISQIVVTMDTHQPVHIAHPVFWQDKAGNNPKPFTIITHDDVASGKWEAARPDLRAHGLWYVQQLEQKTKFSLCIWPPHCLVGSQGHAIVSALHEAVISWALENVEPIHYVMKGENVLTEMYSAIKAEVELESDQNTQFNRSLVECLRKADRVLICGQALSHCVNFTTRDLAEIWDPAEIHKLCILTDASSSVPGFEEAGKKFISDMKNLGLTLLTTETAF